ncbi:hypothetical protein GCM10009805_31480 [Leucobacter chromiireducens subsp. solipictus]
MLNTVLGDDVAERGGVPVRERVITDDTLNTHPKRRVEPDRAFKDTGRGHAFLIVVDLGVRDTRVVIDHGVDVVVPLSSFPVRAFAASVEPPPTTIRDTAEFLHIDMDQRARILVFVSVRGPSFRTDPDPSHGIKFT